MTEALASPNLKPSGLDALAASKPEAMPAHDVFAAPDEVINAVDGAIANGVITYDLARPGQERPNIAINVELEPIDLERRTLSDDEKRNGFSFKSFEEIAPKDPDALLAKTQKTIEENVKDRALLEMQWHLNDESVREDVENGTVRQYLRVFSGSGSWIDIVNFSDTTLTDVQIEQMRATIEKVAALSGETIFDRTNAICIQKPERMRDTVAGSVKGLSGVMLLNEKLINGGFDDVYDKFGDLETDPLETTLTHELGHLVELAVAPGAETYGKTTGWRTESNTFTDDMGDVRSTKRSILEEVPYEIRITDGAGQNGEKVKTKDVYGLDVMKSAKPMTEYAHTNEKEDFAEAFVYYVHGRGKLDPIRKDAIDRVVARGKGDQVMSVGVTEVDLLQGKVGTVIPPHHYTLYEPKYMMKGEASTEAQAQNIHDTNSWYQGQQATFVDDYGNRMTRYGKHAPKAY